MSSCEAGRRRFFVDGGNELEETDLLPLLGADSLLANPPSARGSPGHWLLLLTGLRHSEYPSLTCAEG